MVEEVLSLTRRLEATVSSAIGRVLPEAAAADPVVRRSEHTDFQSNAALALAKRARAKPVELAATVVETLGSDASDAADAGALVAEATVSGPGFVNLTVPDATVWRRSPPGWPAHGWASAPPSAAAVPSSTTRVRT